MNAAVSYVPSPGFLPPASSLHHPSYHYQQHQPSSYPAYPLHQPPTPPVQQNIRLPSINELLPEQCLHTQKRPELPKVNTWAGPATASHPMMSPPVSAASSPASASPVSHHHSYSYSGSQSQPPQPFHHLPSPPHQHANVSTSMMPPHYSASSHHTHHARYDSSMPTRNPAKKRRGNLPRSVTETLRNWLHDHLHHPYPSETEKNQLMQQTGLTMNQISNWFINARRRRLPAMHKNREKQRLYGQQQSGVTSPTRI